VEAETAHRVGIADAGIRWAGYIIRPCRQDPGFDKPRFIEALNAFDRLDPKEFDLDVDDYRRLGALVSTWRQQLEGDLGRDDPGLSFG
jgi:hypothetical protein